MKRYLLLVVFAYLFLTSFALMNVAVQAQDASCLVVVEQALTSVDQLCADLGRNQVCYGNLQISADPATDVTDLLFDIPGSIESLGRISKLSLEALNVEDGTWGVTVLKVQANLPDTLPGQNITFLAFGDTELTNTSGDMTAFYLQTGIGAPLCKEAPRDGLLVQTPQGVGDVQFTLNGVEVAMGSTLFFQAVPEQALTVNVIEGSAEVSAQGRTREIPAGSRVLVPMTTDLEPALAPLSVEPIDPAILEGLPVTILPRNIAEEISNVGDDTADGETSEEQEETRTDGVYHTVKSGENLFRIALYYDTTIQSIVDANSLSNRAVIYAGQVLFIPNPGPGYAGPPSVALTPPPGVVVVTTPIYTGTLIATPPPTTTTGQIIPSSGSYIHYWDSGGVFTYNVAVTDPGRSINFTTDYAGSFPMRVSRTNPNTYYGVDVYQETWTVTFTSSTTYVGCRSVAGGGSACYKGQK